MKILFLSATGNNLYLAKRLGQDCFSIPQCLKQNRFEFKDEKIGIIFPVYYIKVPKIIEQFLEKAKLESNYIFAVLSYGRFSGAASSQLEEIGRRRGIGFSYINEIKMVDNYLPAFKMEEEIRKEPGKNIEGNLEKIIRDVNSGKKYIRNNAFIRRLISEYISGVYLPEQDKKFFNDTLRFDNNYSINDSCNGCGVCSRVCPVDNIQMLEKIPCYLGKCMRCMACIHHCPRNAIHLRCEKSTARFINKHVKLAEIIKAND